MMCTGGSAPSQLQVTSNSLLSVQDNKVATVSDKVPNTNIMPFGKCKLKTFSPPCMPAPMAWTGFLSSVSIPGGNPLLKTSTIQCACGGTIRFQDSGQMKANKVRLNPNSLQIDALKRAALVAAPFCEECEKRKEEKEPKIVDIYWIDEKGEQKTLDDLYPNQEVTLCVDVDEGGRGKTIDIQITMVDSICKFKGGTSKLEFKKIKIEDDNTAYIDNFKIEFEENV